jgi:hypothetical protein
MRSKKNSSATNYRAQLAAGFRPDWRQSVPGAAALSQPLI